MQFKRFAVSAAIILLTVANSNAGDGYFNLVGRNFGYGISDGYHAHRNCLPDYMPCNNCEPAQQPVMPQPMMQQPVIQQRVLQQSMMQPPRMAPAYTQSAPQQFRQAGFPVGLPTAPMYQPQHQPIAPIYDYPSVPQVESRTPRSAVHW